MSLYNDFCLFKLVHILYYVAGKQYTQVTVTSMKKFYPILDPLPSKPRLECDCRHYRSQLGFSITATWAVAACGGGINFIQDGGYSREEPGWPLSHTYMHPAPYGNFQPPVVPICIVMVSSDMHGIVCSTLLVVMISSKYNLMSSSE